MTLTLTATEKEIAIMLASGHNTIAILDWFHLERKDYLKIKKQIFKKMQISRTIQILSVAIKYKII